MNVQFYRVSEAARELGYSEAFLRRAEKTGRIPRAKLDLNDWRVYSYDDIETLRRFLMPTALLRGKHGNNS